MDTTTVQEIIEIIDNKIRNFAKGPLDGMPDDFTIGEEFGMKQIRDHLQSYIEAQVNAAENQTGE
jgi:hypothetical protein